MYVQSSNIDKINIVIIRMKKIYRNSYLTLTEVDSEETQKAKKSSWSSTEMEAFIPRAKALAYWIHQFDSYWIWKLLDYFIPHDSHFKALAGKKGRSIFLYCLAWLLYGLFEKNSIIDRYVDIKQENTKHLQYIIIINWENPIYLA